MLLEYTVQKQLNQKQVQLLMECHESEILKNEPYLGLRDMRFVRSLVQFGLLAAKDYYKGNKKLFGFFITPLGVEYLKNVNVEEISG